MPIEIPGFLITHAYNLLKCVKIANIQQNHRTNKEKTVYKWNHRANFEIPTQNAGNTI